MLRTISIIVSLISHIASDSETLLVSNTLIKERIRNGPKSCILPLAIEEEFLIGSHIQMPDYNNYSLAYICCPKCNTLSHLESFLKSSATKGSLLKCQNTDCALKFKTNDINRLFAHILYVIIAKGLPFAVFKDLCYCYAPDAQYVSHMDLMRILIDSHTLPVYGQERLWDILSTYADTHGLGNGGFFKAYHEVLIYQDPSNVFIPCSAPSIGEIELFKAGSLLCAIDALWNELAQCHSPSDFLAVYDSHVEKAYLIGMQQILGDHLMAYIMRFNDPFYYMEGMYTEKLISTSQEGARASAKYLWDFILSALINNNVYKIEKKTDAYLKSKHKGVLVHELINTFTTEENPDMVKKIIASQLSSLDKNKRFKGMSLPNTMVVLKAAHSLKIPLDHSYFERIIEWAHLFSSKLSSENILCISDLFEWQISDLPKEQCNEIQSLFVRYYTTELAKIYVRCMPINYYKDSFSMLDFSIKREFYLMNEKVENGAAKALAEHKELIELRKAYENEIIESLFGSQALN
ncbi:hypothetical protein ENBRE01_1414 [Enteropsectra breve]|nr:hypothetical protein ENBRE01_1414 [Enteropsectra breve]